jgi:hypothetical protein
MIAWRNPFKGTWYSENISQVAVDMPKKSGPVVAA